MKALYALNLSLLAAHEIDSAYWHEWRLFHLGGGIQLFALLRVALVLTALEGFRRVVLELPWARAFAFALGLAGLGAFAAHMTFLALGHSEFRLPASIVLLVALGISGSGQAAAALVHPRFAFARLSS